MVFFSVKEDDNVVKTSPRTNIVSDIITTRDDVNGAVQQIKNYDIDNIRRIAEQHTLQVLEEAQQNIENNGKNEQIYLIVSKLKVLQKCIV